MTDDGIVSEEWVREEIASSTALFEAEGCGLWGVRRRAGGPLIGFAGYRHFFEPPRLELLYGLLPRFHGRGLATEAAAEAVRYAFEVLGFDRVEAAADAPNEASIRVLDRLGMSFDRRVETGSGDTVFYSLGRPGAGPAGG